MLTQPISMTHQIGRYLLATPLVLALALGYSAAHAQVVPTPAPAEKPIPKNITYYIDGQKSDRDALARIQPDEIENIDVIKMPQQEQIFGTTSADGTVVITTKANTSAPAVLALDKRIRAVLPLVPATPEQNAGTAAAKAYIIKNYPTAKLEMVGPAHGKPGRYQAYFVENGKRLQLLFDGNGQPVQQ